jgi:hypothetical protein
MSLGYPLFWMLVTFLMVIVIAGSAARVADVLADIRDELKKRG